jgi:hypothetical protein
MNFLINLERQKIESQMRENKFNSPMLLGIRFYSDKLVLDAKKSYPNKTIRQILIELAELDAKRI